MRGYYFRAAAFGGTLLALAEAREDIAADLLRHPLQSAAAGQDNSNRSE